MSVAFPEATPVLGNVKVVIVDTVANLAAPKLATEIGATGSLDASCYVRAFNPEVTTNSGSSPDRLCTTITLPQEGRTSISPVSLAYIYDPQGDTTDLENKLRTKLTRGSLFYAIVRKGKPFESPLVVGDHVEVWRIRCGKRNDVQSGDDEFAEFEVQQMLFPTADKTDGIVAT